MVITSAASHWHCCTGRPPSAFLYIILSTAPLPCVCSTPLCSERPDSIMHHLRKVHSTWEFCLFYWISQNGWSSATFTNKFCHLFLEKVWMARLNLFQHREICPGLLDFHFDSSLSSPLIYLKIQFATPPLNPQKSFCVSIFQHQQKCFSFMITMTMKSIMSTPEQTLVICGGWPASVHRHTQLDKNVNLSVRPTVISVWAFNR